MTKVELIEYLKTLEQAKLDLITSGGGLISYSFDSGQSNISIKRTGLTIFELNKEIACIENKLKNLSCRGVFLDRKIKKNFC